MDILPIDKIRDEDAPIVGADLVNLSRLSQLGFPVAKGIVVVPPDFKLRTVLEHLNLRDKEVFEQSLTIIKQEVAKIPAPDSLTQKLKSHKISSEKIWQELLNLWLEEVRKRIWRDGLSKGVTANLSAQSVFFTNKIYSSGKAFVDPETREVVVEEISGVVEIDIKLDLEKIVKSANRKLFIPQNYYWVTESKADSPKLVRVTPFTHYQKSETQYGIFDGLSPKSNPVKEPRSAVKIFLKSPKSFELSTNVDGVVIYGEESKNFDEKVFKLVETASTIVPNEVIYKLSDIEDQVGGVRGALRLNHQESLLREDAQAVLFARNKKDLGNISVGIPFTRSTNEFLQVKRNLSALGISRKGSLKLWLELTVPENFLNLEEYLIAGVDGVIIHLDELSSWLGGFDHRIPESIFYKKQISALLKFIDDSLKLLHKSRVPFMASGSLAMHDDVLAYLVEKGVYGVLADMANSGGLNEHLRFVEKRVVRSRA